MFGFPLQRTLLPTLLISHLLTPIGLFGQLLLTSRQLLQFLNRLVDFLAAGITTTLVIEGGRLFGFVLIALEVHLEFEQLGEIPGRATAATATTTALLLRHLNIGEQCFGTQNKLQRLLGRTDGSLQFNRLEVFSSGAHRLDRQFEIFHVTTDARIRAIESPCLRAFRQ